MKICQYRLNWAALVAAAAVALASCSDEAAVVTAAAVDTGVAADAGMDSGVVGGNDSAAAKPDTATAPDTGSDASVPDAAVAEVAADAGGDAGSETTGGCENGKACDDGDACTDNDTCKDGKCAGAPKVCDDQNACTTDTCDSKTGCAHANADGPCDDGSACTEKDACKDGKCAGAALTCDDANPCTDDTCDKAKGCAHAANTAPCDDGNGCTLGDACAAGACAGGKLKACDDGNPCTKDACDAVAGACAATPVDINCDDSTLCTENDKCVNGNCKGTAVACDDGNKCTTDTCDGKTGCSYIDNNGLCDDGNACTDFDKCAAGKCKGTAKDASDCDDGNKCTTDSCDKVKGCVNAASTGACDDGDPCTPDDTCTDGKCQGGASICPCKADADCAAKEDGNFCNGTLYCDTKAAPFLCKVKPSTIVTCDTSLDGACANTTCDKLTGKCSKVNEADGKACDADGSACTANDACAGGACKAGAAQACDDNNPCTTDSCDPKVGCVYAANTSPCDADGNACTVGDQCGDKVCTTGKLKACNDNELCTKDSCDTKTGNCTFDAKAMEGQACDADGSNCTPDDACTAGTCAAGKALDCDDKNVCTIDKCDAKTGCAHIANSAACDADGDACTQNDQCDNKLCVAGVKKNCDDGDACTTDTCDAKTAACGHAVIMGCGGNCGKDADCDDQNPCTDDSCANSKCAHKTNSAPCDDGSKCTTSDVCAGGKCGGTAVKCNDSNPCTDDSCQPASGCTATNNDVPCDDGNACTTGDACSLGKCGTGKPKVCDDGDACTNDTCNPGDGSCKFTGINGCGIYCAKASDCNDNNLCTDESCQGGKCVSVNNTIACDDGNACTAPDLCGSGKCNSGAQKNCNDNNQCTTDGCDTKTAVCTYIAAAATATCNDNNACTANDACGGVGPTGLPTCVGAAKNCDDGNACTTDSCNAGNAGCVNTPNSGAACDDNNACSVGDICASGSCTAGNKLWVDTIAGSTAGFTDDKGAKAQFNLPYGVAADGSGNLYVADSANNRVRKIAPDGTVTTLAGQTNPGLLDGKGGAAQFNNPYGITADAKGDLIVADTLNHSIRKVTAGGDVTVLAGAGVAGWIDATGVTARFNRPYGAAANAAGGVVVADTFNHRIRRISDKGVVTTLAGDGNAGFQDGPGKTARFNFPTAVIFDAAGNVLVVDNNNHRIRKVAIDGTVSTVAGSGTAGYLDGGASLAMFNGPWGITALPDGSFIVSDRNNMRLRRIAGNAVSTWAGDGGQAWVDGVAPTSRFNLPAHLATDSSGYVYVADGNNQRIRRVRDATSYCAIAGKCYVTAAANPQNACQTCQPGKSATQFTALADGAACTDGDFCTVGDACASGSCGAGAAPNCDDKDNCTNDACDANTGACVNSQIIGCGGNCVQASDCDDKNPCTTDACVTNKCQNNNNSSACDDGNACTLNDSCLNGKCVPGSVVLISTLAGGQVGNADGKGVSAKFNHPSGVARDSKGNLYVADWSNNNVRKIAPDGTVTTLAGSGTAGFADGTGANAYFYNPLNAEVAPDGTLYISDWSNSRVRAIDVNTGAVTTSAGGIAGYLDGGVGVARFNGVGSTCTTPSGTQYIIDGNNNRVRKLQAGQVTTLAGGAAGYADGPGAKAQFNAPRGCALDAAGNLYVADHNNNMIRKVTAEGVVSTVAGTGQPGFLDGNAGQAVFQNPFSVAWDPSGTLTVVDRGNQRIRRISASGVVSTLAGNGAYGATDGNAALATFASPIQAAVDPYGAVYIGDWDSARVRKIVDAIKPCLIGNACYATGAVNPGNDCQACDGAKNASNWTGRADGSGCSDGQFCTVNDACSGGKCGAAPIDCDDKDQCTTDACDKETGACTHVKIVGCNGFCTANNQCDDKNVCTTDSCTASTCAFVNNTVACDDGNPCTIGDVCSNGKCLVGVDVTTQVVAGSGVNAYADATGTAASFNFPLGVEIMADGTSYVADTGNHRIRKILADGTVTTFAGSGNSGLADGKGVLAWFSGPADIAAGPGGVLYVADRDNNAIRAIQPDGTVTTLAGNGAAGTIDDVGAKARFWTPYSLAVTSGGIIYVADYSSHRIRKITPQGKVTTLAGSAAGYKDDVGAKALFNNPIGVGVDTQGNVYVGDYSNHRIRKITPEGVVSTVAGNGIAGTLDSDVANASFQYPWGIAVGQNGAIYVADRYNHKIRKIFGGQVSTFAGSGIAGFLDGPAPQARFQYPDNIAMDGRGWIYVADGHNHRIRRVRDTAASCDIGGVCYTNGVASPKDQCQACDGAKTAAQWTAKVDAAVCTDGDLCTTGDVCASGTCAGGKNSCDDKNACTADSCEATSGMCVNAAIPNCP